MKSRLQHYALFGLFCLAMSIQVGQAWSAETTQITGVTVSPDAKHIAIRWDGPAGDHNAFLLSRPTRLVIDLEGTTLARVPRTIPVNKAPVKEIRVGYSGTRARVVVDLGDEPTPAYRVHKEGNRLIVVLGANSPVVSALINKKKIGTHLVKGSVTRTADTEQQPQAQKEQLVALKSAGVTKDLIVLELADLKNPKRSCRLVLEVDMERLKVRRATLSDQKGALEKSELSSNMGASQDPESRTATVRGPRREAEVPVLEEGRKTMYRWGMPIVRPAGPRVTAWRAEEPK